MCKSMQDTPKGSVPPLGEEERLTHLKITHKRGQLLIPGPVGSLPLILSGVLEHGALRRASLSVISAFLSLRGLYYQVYALSVSFIIWVIYGECCRYFTDELARPSFS